MYVDRHVRLSSDARAALEQFEQESERPLRVLYGNARTYTPHAWSAEMREACGNPTVAACHAEGVTLVAYGTLHSIQRYTNVQLPYVYGEPDEGWFNYYDAIAFPDDQAWLARPDVVLLDEQGEEQIVGEIAAGVVCHYGMFVNYQHQDWERLLLSPLRLCRDADYVGAMAEAQANHNRDRFLKYAQRSTNQGVEVMRREVDELVRYEGSYREKLAQTVTQLRNKQRLLDAALKIIAEEDGDTTAKLLDAWEQMQADERIERLVFQSDNKLMIETAGLDITHPTDGRTVYLGRFRWHIDIENTTIRVENLDNQRGGYDHPHINHGTPCFGNLGDTVYELLRRGDLYPALEMVFAFLGTINLADDWSRRATFWFDDDQDRTLGTQVAEPAAA